MTFTIIKDYISDFERFTTISDVYILGILHANDAPVILSREMLQSKDCKIKVVADVSCDVNGASCTLRSSTMQNLCMVTYQQSIGS
jgi:alanine dehydrogenase